MYLTGDNLVDIYYKRVLEKLTREDYEKLHTVWISSKVGFLSFVLRIAFFNLVFLGISKVIDIFIRDVSAVIKTKQDSFAGYMVLDDFWGLIGQYQFKIMPKILLVVLILSVIIWIVYGRKNFQKLDLAWEIYLLFVLVVTCFIMHISLMIFFPNIFNLKSPITIVLTILYLRFVLLNIMNGFKNFSNEDDIENVIEINVITKKAFYIALPLYALYLIFKGEIDIVDSIYMISLSAVTVFIHVLLIPYAMNYQIKQIIYRCIFIKHSEEFRDKFQMTKEEWYGTKSK